MSRYVLVRLLRFIIVVWGVATLMFAILFLSTDPTKLFVGMDATEQQMEQVRENMGFNAPVLVRYGRFLKQTLSGNLGYSWRYQVPVSKLVLQRLPASLQLTSLSIALALALGVPAGVIAAVKRGTVLDLLVMAGAVVVQGMPVFWSGILLILIFAVKLRVLPASGSGDLRHLLLPSFTLGGLYTAQFARLTRSAILEVLQQEYVRTARSKGLTETVILYRHVLKNAGIPIVALLSVSIPTIFGGSIVTETVFAWPGLGRILAIGVQNGDYPLVQGCVLAISVLVATISLLSDMLYAYLDPRVSFT